MAGGFHSTSPLYHSVALVANVTSKLPSALKSWSLLSFLQKIRNFYRTIACIKTRGEIHNSNLLIVQHNVGSPNVVGRYVQLLDSSILHGVPNQFVIVPKLKLKRKKSNAFSSQMASMYVVGGYSF